MIFFKIILGLFFLFLGLIYLYNQNLVLNINRVVRDVFFNDKKVILERKKLAILFFCFAFISLYMGFTSLAGFFEKQDKKVWFIEPLKYSMYIASQDYYAGRYQSAIERYKKILPLSSDQHNVLKCMAFTYLAMGDKEKAKILLEKLAQINPDDRIIKIKLKQLKAQNEKKSK
jgi:tetratricopeptide (TPR) repeat protein